MSASAQTPAGQPEPAELARPGEALPRWLTAILLALSIIGVAATVLLAVIHVGDRYAVQSPSGVLMALADDFRRGIIFPPLLDGEHFGGTRYMPLSIMFHAGLAALTGDYLVSGKLLGILSSAVLMAVLYAVLRGIGAGRVVAIALAVTVLVGQVGALAALSIRPEAIPTVLQLCALAAVSRSRSRPFLALAAALCIAAVLSKVSAGAAPLAICLWLLARDRRGLGFFVLVFLGGLFGALAILQVVSDGRMTSSFLELGGAGITLSGAITAPLRALEYLSQYAAASLLLLPVAWFAMFEKARLRDLSVYQIALIVSAIVLAALMTDQGADYNHLLDVVVLMSVVTAEGLRGAQMVTDRPSTLRLVTAFALVVGLSLSIGTGAGFDLALAVKQLAAPDASVMYDPRPLAGIVDPGETVLSDDPYVPLSAGQRPLVLDAFMLLRIERRHPMWVQGLADQIRARHFDKVVLRRPIGTPESEVAYRTQELGATVYQAIKEAYRLDEVVRDAGYSHLLPARDFFVYAPLSAP